MSVHFLIEVVYQQYWAENYFRVQFSVFCPRKHFRYRHLGVNDVENSDRTTASAIMKVPLSKEYPYSREGSQQAC